MAYGIQLENSSSKLTLSSDGVVLGYLGKATHTGTVQHDSIVSGYSTYTINHAALIVAAIKLETSQNSAIIGMSQAGSTWTITAYHGASPYSAEGFETQYTADIYCWGLPTTATGYGCAIYDASGVLKGDLSKRPLDMKQKLDWGSGTATEAMAGGITAPAIIGLLDDWQRIRTGSGPWTFRFDSGAWAYSGTHVNRVWVQREYYPNEDAGNPTLTERRACKAVLVEVFGLPA